MADARQAGTTAVARALYAKWLPVMRDLAPQFDWQKAEFRDDRRPGPEPAKSGASS